MSDRHPCSCRLCHCPSTAYAAGNPCSSCTVGIHRPSREVQAHLAAGLEEWIRILASTKASWGNGKGPDQPSDAAAAWLEWHAKRPCPVSARRAA